MNAETLHDALKDRAFLHDDPGAYLAGVDDALEALTSGAGEDVEPPQVREPQHRRGA